jgi:anaerobic magnesium-protoporphyrin IX monomethyl ester cyclase
MKIGLVYLSENDATIYPIGLLSIAAMLNRIHPQHKVEIIDANFEDPFEKAIDAAYDVLGISSMTIEYEKATRLALHIKSQTSAPVILGGVHISTIPQSFRSCFDLGVMGEGEETFCEIIAAFETSGNLLPPAIRHIKGIVYRDNEELVLTPPRDLLDDLDKIPKLDYSKIRSDYFRSRGMYQWGDFGKLGMVLTSRGCPYKCVFCSTTQFWNKVRCFSIERIIDEIVDLVDNYHVDHIQLSDDLFTLNKRRLRLFANEFRRRSLHKKVAISCQSRTNLIDDELCEILVSINTKIISFGFESGNDRMLRFLKCDSTSVEQNMKAIALCTQYHLNVFGSVIFGSPTETLEEMEDTVRFIASAKKLGAYSLWAFVMTPYPATSIWETAKCRGKVEDNMNFDLLNLKSKSRPLLLDEHIDYKKFRKIWFRAKLHLLGFSWNMLLPLIRKHPVQTAQLVLSNLLLRRFPLKTGRRHCRIS